MIDILNNQPSVSRGINTYSIENQFFTPPTPFGIG